MDAGRNLAETLCRRRGDDLTGEDVARLSLLLLDYVGVAFLGAASPTAGAIRRSMAPSAAPGRAVVIGGRARTEPSAAAFFNAVAAHDGELDDTHDESLSHTGAVVISACLALAADHPSSGLSLLSAIAGGYEAMARIGMAAQADKAALNGFHPTGIFGGFGAATGAILMMGLSEEALTGAWGLVLSAAGGSMQFSQEPEGAAVKLLHAGRSAQTGITAAYFARNDIVGPKRALDGRYGACSLFSKAPRLERLRSEGPLQIHNVTIKLYPSCRMCHAALDGLEACTDGFSADWRSIREIRVAGPAKLRQHLERRPGSTASAQYSLPYAIAAALRFGPRELKPFEAEQLRDFDTLALADRVTLELDEELDSRFPQHIGSRVEVRFADGSVRSALCRDSRGTPRRPPTADDVTEKAKGLMAAAGLRNEEISDLVEAVAGIGASPDSRPLLSALGRGPRSERIRPRSVL